MKSSSCLIMVDMAPCFKELLSLIMKNRRLKRRLLSKMNSFDYNSIKLGPIMSSRFRMTHIESCLQELLSFVHENYVDF